MTSLLQPTNQRSGAPFHRLVRAGAIAVVVVLGLSACGGQPEPSFADVFEQAEGLEGLEELEELEVLQDLLEGQENGTSASFGDAEVSMGDTGRPDWLASWVQFPEEMEYALAVNDPSTGEQLVGGLIRGAKAEDLEAQMFAMVKAQGYERMGETGYFVKAGEPTLDISVYDDGVGAQLRWEHSSESEEALRDAYAPTETTGTLTLEIQGETVAEIAGDCTLRSTSAEFEGENASFSLSTFVDREPAIFSSVFVGDADSYAGWTVGFHGETDPVTTLTGSGFVIDAPFWDSFSGEDPVPGVATLICD